MCNGGTLANMSTGPNEATIQAPATTVWAFDCYCEYTASPMATMYSVGWWLSTQPRSQISCWRHNEGINACFVDGHVKWVKWIKASDLSTDPTDDIM